MLPQPAVRPWWVPVPLLGSKMVDDKPVGKSPLRGGDLALQPVIAVLLCGAAGYGLDQWLGWTPWAMLVGGVLGFIAAMRILWQAVK